MDSLVFRCPGCQQPFQVLAEQAGQMVRCPGCENTVQIPAVATTQSQMASSKEASPKESQANQADGRRASGAQTEAEEVQAYGCPECKQPFGIYPSMFGSEMACPHCRQTVLLQSKPEPEPKPTTQRTPKQPPEISPTVAAPPAAAKRKRTPKPKTQPPVTAKQNPDPAKLMRPGKSLSGIQSGEATPVVSPPVSAVAATATEAAFAPTGKTTQAQDQATQADHIDEATDTPAVVFVQQPVGHLLPPKFSAVDPDFFYRRHNDGSQVLLPSEDGGLKVVDNRIVRIEHNGQVYELISSPRYERIQKMVVTNVLAVIICGLLIAIVMTLLNG
jgi:DNA-directed RNA polymerase subunit RPC12/RpoP